MPARLLCVLLALCFALTARAADYEVRTDARVVAFADVHGAFDDWVTLLQEVDVIDDQLNWSGGNTHLVSVGDLIDRGPGSRDVVELLMKLEGQARQAGGAVHMALGNHEVMVLTGNLSYVSKAEFSAFAADETAAERDALFAEYQKYSPGATRADFDKAVAPGFIGLRKAYATSGELGAWLSKRPFAVKVNDKLYMHGGISSTITDMNLKELNQKLQGELQGYLAAVESLDAAGQLPSYVGRQDRLNFLNARVEDFAAANPRSKPDWFKDVQLVFAAQEYLLFDPFNAPTWYRGTSRCHPLSESFNTEKFLKKSGAKQLVVGHDPSRGTAISRMDGLVIRLDTGMLRSVYKGRAAAFISNDGPDYIHYLGATERTEAAVENTSLSRRLSGMEDAELEAFMRTAPASNVEDIGTGVTNPWRVTQTQGDFSNDAVFKYEDTNPGMQDAKKYISRRYNDSDRYQYDVAAYKLDRMLGMEMVPTAVISEVRDREGALSDWVTGAINERDRLEQDLPFESYCKQWEQYRMRFVFDILTHNTDRNLTNILWDKKSFMLRFIDHSLAFRTSDRRPKQYAKVDLEVSDLLMSRLQSLNMENLTAELRPYLHPRQIEAILERRDRILKEAERSGD
ncbi:hypothetical protein EY643_04145 [Halioglobus maricola]|uniref:Calcineurin-like phosphoesterase domain-containing protein n=1 Tax=Halioglobus maricola TaxID=2601894 RepID=A0A5P9NI78_9GAMM|nr:metallophosphoesterase [Halioglobus maricola]QFU74894.1 hypothetical protein EY643_04145 [Halioglobus maricola]